MLVPQVSCSIGAVIAMPSGANPARCNISTARVSRETIFRASEIEREYASNDFQGGADTSKVRDATDGA
jgi:hypothetical protein